MTFLRLGSSSISHVEFPTVKARTLPFKILLGMLILALFIVTVSRNVIAAPNPNIAISPKSGPVGTEISIVGQDFSPSSDLDLRWSSAEGEWVVDGHDFLGSSITTKEYVIASVKSDSSGSFNMLLKAPYDFGGSHFITILPRGNSTELAKAVFTLLPSFSISPTEGPPGTAIAIRAHGLGYRRYTTNYHVLWDNKYVGYATAITTKGNATFEIYAVGDPGTHYIDIYEGYPGPGYLNIQEGPPDPGYYSPPLIPFHTEFTITPPLWVENYNSAETFAVSSLGLTLVALVVMSLTQKWNVHKSRRWMLSSLIIIIAIALAGLALFYANGAIVSAQTKSVEIRPEIILPEETSDNGLPSISVNPRLATVNSNVTIFGSGFSSGSSVELFWTTRTGSYLRGWNDVIKPLRNVTADSSGSFSFNMSVPYELEGPHTIGGSLGDDSSSVRNATLYITRSALISPTMGPSGTVVEIRMTGVGWTFVTNTATIVYDNSFVGYACGFNSMGNVTVYVKAVGKPGIHTIDIYPTIYDGPPPGEANTIYRYPLLTPEDHPARSPAFHFEFLIAESDQKSEGSGLITPQNIGIATIGVGVVSLVLSTMFRVVPKRTSDSLPPS